MNVDQLIEVGKIHKSFRLKGWMKISFEAFFMPHLEALEVLFIKEKESYIPYFVDDLELHDQYILMKFEEIDTREEGNTISNKVVFADCTKFDALKEDGLATFDYGFVQGFQLSLKDAKEQYEVLEILKMPQQEMAVLEINGKEVLLPIHPDLIFAIDETAKEIILDLPHEYLDL